MKTSFWKAITFILTGLIIGLIAADKLGMGVETVFKGQIRIKQRGEGNILNSDIKPEIAIKPRKLARIATRLEKRKARAELKTLRKAGK